MGGIKLFTEDTQEFEAIFAFTGVLTLERVIELAKAEVAAMGKDYVYVNPLGKKAGYDDNAASYVDCYNWNHETNQPSCIVGRVLFAAGVPAESLSKWDNSSSSAFFSPGKQNDLPARFLRHLQSNQDHGMNWGDALEGALVVVKVDA